MFRWRAISLIIILALIFSGCAGNQAKPNPTQAEQPAAQPTLVTVRLPMGYIPSVQFAPFYVAVDKGYFQAEGIKIDFDYSYETDAVKLVGANNLQFAIVSGEQVLLARAQGLPITYVMAWWQNYPVAVASKVSSNITKPADLAGKKIGIPILAGASYIGLRALLEAGGVKESDVTLDTIGYNQVEALTAGQEEAVVVYVNNEPIQLKARGVDVNVMRVSDYVQLASNGLISNETTIANNPGLVRGMIQAISHGISDTLANPDEAFEISKKYVEGLDKVDPNIQKEILATSIEFWKTDQIGRSNPEAWTNMDKLLTDMGLLTKPVDLSKAYTNEFISK
jgi:NitT/TauT family transport system substrate-binding protein